MRVESLQPAQLDGPLQDQLLIQLRNKWLTPQLVRLRERILEAADDVPLALEVMAP